jgi:hypothetical protein
MFIPEHRRHQRRKLPLCFAVLFLGACSQAPETPRKPLVVIGDPQGTTHGGTLPGGSASIATLPTAALSEAMPVEPGSPPPPEEEVRQEAAQAAARESDPYRIADSVLVDDPDGSVAGT